MEWFLIFLHIFAIRDISIQGLVADAVIHAQVHADVIIQCGLRGHNISDVNSFFWVITKLNTRLLPYGYFDSKYVIHTQGQLEIKNVKFEDSSDYTCKFRNRNNGIKSEVTTSLVVQDTTATSKIRYITLNSLTITIGFNAASTISTVASSTNNSPIVANSSTVTNSNVTSATEKFDVQTKTTRFSHTVTTTSTPTRCATSTLCANHCIVLTKEVVILGGGAIAVGQLFVIVTVFLVRFLIRKKKRRSSIRQHTVKYNNSANRGRGANPNRRIPGSRSDLSESIDSGKTVYSIPSHYTYIDEKLVGPVQPLENLPSIPFMRHEASSSVTTFPAKQSVLLDGNPSRITDQAQVNNYLHTVFEGDEGSDDLDEIMEPNDGEKRPRQRGNKCVNAITVDSGGYLVAGNNLNTKSHDIV